MPSTHTFKAQIYNVNTKSTCQNNTHHAHNKIDENHVNLSIQNKNTRSTFSIKVKHYKANILVLLIINK